MEMKEQKKRPGLFLAQAAVREAEAGNSAKADELIAQALAHTQDQSVTILSGFVAARTGTVEKARAIADKVNVFVALTRSAETSVGSHGTDADVKAFFDSLKIRDEGDRAVLTAVMPFGFLRKMLSGPAADLSEPSNSTPAQAPAKSR